MSHAAERAKQLRRLAASALEFPSGSRLSPAELELLLAAAHGRHAQCGGGRLWAFSRHVWRTEHTVRPALLEWLFSEPGLDGLIHPLGVHVTGAYLNGPLILRGDRDPLALSLVNCRIEGAVIATNLRFADIRIDACSAERINLSGSTLTGNFALHSSWLQSTRVAALDLSGSTISGALSLAGSRVTGETRLIDARIRGSLVCAGTDMDSGAGDALSADRTEIGGGVFLTAGFRAVGCVRLAGANISGPIQLQSARLERRYAGALLADGVRAAAIAMHKVYASGEVRFPGAAVRGQFSCRDTLLETPHANALTLDNASLAGSVVLSQGFCAMGEVRLLSADVGGPLNCRGGMFLNPDGYALALDVARIAGTVFLNEGFVAQGEVRLTDTTVGSQLTCSGARFLNPTGPALRADGIKVARDVYLRGNLTVLGSLDFGGATIGGSFRVGPAKIFAEDAEALSAHRLTAEQGIDLVDLDAVGAVDLTGVSTSGSFRCRSVSIQHRRRVAFAADGAWIKGSLRLEAPFAIEGEVRLQAANVEGQLVILGAHLKNGEGDALTADGIKIGEDLYVMDQFVAEGAARFVGAVVGGQCRCSGRFVAEDKPALILNEAVVEGDAILQPNDLSGWLVARRSNFRGTLYLALDQTSVTSPELPPVVDLTGAQIGTLDERFTAWQSVRPAISGCQYEAVAVPQGHRSAERWLESRLEQLVGSNHTLAPSPSGSAIYRAHFDAGPYRQLARTLHGQGLSDLACDVAVTREAARRRAGHVGPAPSGLFRSVGRGFAWVFHSLYGLTSGYGYRTLRPAALLAVVIALGSIVYALAGPEVFALTKPPSSTAAAPQPDAPFDPQARVGFPIAYSLDVALPVIDLHEESVWQPVGDGWGTAARVTLVWQILAGWFFTTLLGISLGKRIARDPA